METPPFQGVIGDDWRDSTPWWPEGPTPPAGAPNVVLVVLDDVGFAQLGCYGSDIATPTIDGLAAERPPAHQLPHHGPVLPHPGLPADRAQPPPQRAGTGGRPRRRAPRATTARSPRRTASSPRSSASRATPPTPWASGTSPRTTRPPWPRPGTAGPWPGASTAGTASTAGRPTSSCRRSTTTTTPWPRPGPIDEGYHLSADLADQAIAQLADLRAVDADRPFFLYFCTGACHSPHHAPREWIDRYRGHFDGGWDRLAGRDLRPPARARASCPRAPRWPPGRPGSRPGTTCPPRSGGWRPGSWSASPPSSPTPTPSWPGCSTSWSGPGTARTPWSSWCPTTAPAPRAGPPARSTTTGSRTSTRPVPTSCPAGSTSWVGPRAHNNYPWGWTMAGNTPFKRWKREVHEGGVADPCIVSWPARHHRGRRHPPPVHPCHRHPPHRARAGRHRGAPTPSSTCPRPPSTGSASPRCSAPEGGPTRRPTATTQYFEMFGSRAIYHDGWKAVTFKPIGPLYDDGLNWNAPFSEDRWELYHVAEDPTELHDLADAEPDRLADMIERWWAEARRNQVLPLDNRILHTLVNPKPDRRAPRLTTTYYPGTSPVPETVAANMKNRGHAIEVDLTVPEGPPAEGVLLAQGSALGRLLPPPARGTAALPAQPLRQGALSAPGPSVRSRPGRTGSCSASSARGTPAGRPHWRWTASGWPRPSSPCSPWPPSAPPAPASPAGTSSARPWARTTGPRSRARPPSTRPPSPSASRSPVNPIVEFERIMAEQ